MITLEGMALSPGVARGPVVMVWQRPRGESWEPVDGSPAQERFSNARRDAEAELRRALDALVETNGPARDILRAHLALLSDPMLAATVESHIVRDGLGASAAVDLTAMALASRFEGLADPVMRQRAADVRDVCECIARHLAGWVPRGSVVSPPRIICAAELSPAQVIELAPDPPLAFVLERGTDTSHAAILMRALAVPVVIGVPDATTLVKDGDVMIVDGNSGQVLVNPSPDASLPAAVAESVELSDPEPACTSDGIAIAVTATIADAADARRAMVAGADGIGLFRTEMLFLRSGGQLPSESAQELFYREVGSAIGSRPLTVRLLDLGADKHPPTLRLPSEPNPALGLRGVRLLLARPDLLMPQLHALMRASAGRVRVRLLLPMVVDVADVTRVREMIDAASRAVASPVAVDIGAMVETPAAALMADELATAVDFMSIGTNDLAQYVLAADRESAHMARFYQPLHPAVLRLVRGVVAAGVDRGVPVSVCGEMAADPRAVPVFVGMGVTELSVRPSAVAAVKAQVRRIAREAAQALAEEVASLPTAIDVAARIDAATEMESGSDVRERRNAR